MTRRISRLPWHRQAIVDALAEAARPLTVDGIAALVDRQPGTLYADLAALERRDELITSESAPPVKGSPPRRMYRIAAVDETGQSAV